MITLFRDGISEASLTPALDLYRDDQGLHCVAVAHPGADLQQEAPIHVLASAIAMLVYQMLTTCSLSVSSNTRTVDISVSRYAGCEVDI